MTDVGIAEYSVALGEAALADVNEYLWKRSRLPTPFVTSEIAKKFKLPAGLHASQATALLGKMSADEWTAAGLKRLEPPEGVHWMGQQSGVFLDLGGADELVSALTEAALGFKSGGRYLDFGCSSGRTLRTFQLMYPDAEWHGADPDPKTINWAQENLPGMSFLASPQLPPLPYDDAFFDGVYAISVWSHFREDVAMAWFSEMQRVIRSGGILVFTVPGYAKYANKLRQHPEAAKRITEGLKRFKKTGYVFAANFAKQGNRNLDTTIWGAAQVSLAWVTKNLLGPWALRKMIPAGNRGQQDIYVLQRMAS